MWYRQEHWKKIREKLFIPVKVAVELGTFKGQWVIHALSGIPCGHIYCVDNFSLFRKAKIKAQWHENTKRARSKITLLEGTTEEWGKKFDKTAQLIWVDASHEYEDVLQDIRLWWPKLEVGGTMFFHDSNLEGVARATKEIFDSDLPHYNFGPGDPARTQCVLKERELLDGVIHQ